jgi:hypothetical protein
VVVIEAPDAVLQLGRHRVSLLTQWTLYDMVMDSGPLKDFHRYRVVKTDGHPNRPVRSTRSRLFHRDLPLHGEPKPMAGKEVINF